MTVAVAQGIGVLGFATMLFATQMRTRSGLLIVDVVGILLVSVHWVLLQEWTGAAFNTVFALISGLGYAMETRPWAKRAYWALYPSVAVGALLFASGREWLAAAGTFVAVIGIHQRELKRLRATVASSSAFWLVFGVLAGSIGQVVFGVLFLAGHIWRLARPSKAQQLAVLDDVV